jgi:L-rhamnose mutarotase
VSASANLIAPLFFLAHAAIMTPSSNARMVEEWGMQRIAFRMRIRPGKYDDYVKAHANVWPEMLAELRAAGYRNYSIFADGLELFGYFETDDVEKAEATMALSEVNRKWQAWMQEYLITPVNDEGQPVFTFLPSVFYME